MCTLLSTQRADEVSASSVGPDRTSYLTNKVESTPARRTPVHEPNARGVAGVVFFFPRLVRCTNCPRGVEGSFERDFGSLDRRG